MRICLVSHGFPPIDRTGVEQYTAALAAALVRQGHTVEVFTQRRDETQPDASIRREERDGFAVNWFTINRSPGDPREMLELPFAARRFGDFLERERPQLVHFQHVIKLGVGLIHEAKKRDIPTVYTAHDYYAVCHRYTLLRPDLAHCDVRGDARACSRCDVALGYLNGIPDLGDYQMGVVPEQLDGGQRAALDAILAGERDDASEDAHRLRAELDGIRAEAFAALDLVIAPTEFLKGELVRGGLDGERVEVIAYGIENADLREVPPLRVDGSRPLRFAFFGGLSKHKGAHELIEAYRRVSVPAELAVWGYTTDTPFLERLRVAASEAGARWCGPYERADLPRHMADADVVVVPSIWVENYPLVIREAFSARRPVITYDFGALPESVRDGIDGLLVPPGDVDALAAALERCAREPELAQRLAVNAPAVKDVDEQARELAVRYERLMAQATATRVSDGFPESLRPFAERHARLSSLPTRELFQRALAGLDRLRTTLGGEVAARGALQHLAAGFESFSDAQLLLRDARQELEWLRNERESARRAFTEERDWLRGRAETAEQAAVAEGQAELEWRRNEMESAQSKVRSGLLRLLLWPTVLGKRMAGWDREREGGDA